METLFGEHELLTKLLAVVEGMNGDAIDRVILLFEAFLIYILILKMVVIENLPQTLSLSYDYLLDMTATHHLRARKKKSNPRS
jgi:hypothetical protein